MSTQIKCPHCARRYHVEHENAGKQVRCKACGNAFRIPPLASPPESPSPPDLAGLLDEFDSPASPDASSSPKPAVSSLSDPAPAKRRKQARQKRTKGPGTAKFSHMEYLGTLIIFFTLIQPLFGKGPIGPYT